MEDLPSWCPKFASVSGPMNPTRHYGVPHVVRKRASAFACYEHFPGFQNVRVNVLKLDTTSSCVDIACPLDDTGPAFSPPSDIEVSRALETALEHWLVQIRAAFSGDDCAPGLIREVTEFLYGDTERESLLPIKTFWKTLNHMLSLTDSGRQPTHVYGRFRDSAEYRHTLTMLSSQNGRYLFKTTSGEIGFSTRQPTPGNHVVLLPGSYCMHMLTGDCTQYSGCVTLSRMWNEFPLLDLVNARENMWEMVELR